MAIDLTPAAVASPPSAMELAAAEPLLAVEVLPARQSLAAAPTNSRCLHYLFFDLTGPHLFSTMLLTRTVTLHTTDNHNIMNYLLIPVIPIPMYSVEDTGVRARD
jgi:hypothetical protein